MHFFCRVFKIMSLFDCHWFELFLPFKTCGCFFCAQTKTFKLNFFMAMNVLIILTGDALSRLPFFSFGINKISLWAPCGTPGGKLIELNCINMAPCMSYQPEHRSLMPSCLRLYGILIPALERDVCFIISSKQLSHGCLFTAKPGLNRKHR